MRHQSLSWLVLFVLGDVAFGSGERGVPAGGAGEHKEILLDGEGHNESRGGGYRKGERIYFLTVLREHGNGTGYGLFGEDGVTLLSDII